MKKSDKGDFYKRQLTWELRDLTEVDAKDASKVRNNTFLWPFFVFSLRKHVFKADIVFYLYGLGKSWVWSAFWESLPVGGQQYSWKKLLYFLHLEAEPALSEEEGGVCECQFSAAWRCVNKYSTISHPCDGMPLATIWLHLLKGVSVYLKPLPLTLECTYLR